MNMVLSKYFTFCLGTSSRCLDKALFLVILCYNSNVNATALDAFQLFLKTGHPERVTSIGMFPVDY